MNTGAALGFTNTLFEVLSKEKPTHIGVATDGPTKTFRHDNLLTKGYVCKPALLGNK